MSEKRKTKHAENQRRYDQRRRDGLRSVPLTEPLDIGHGFKIAKMFVDLVEVEELLTTLGLLDSLHADDPEHVMQQLRVAFAEGHVSIKVASGRPENEIQGTLCSDHGRKKPELPGR